VDEPRPDFSLIVKDNEKAAALSIQQGNNVQTFLMIHALIEALLRMFLRADEDDLRFSDLVQRYAAFLRENNYPEPDFVDELTQFNRRRNRIVHRLWRHGFTYTNDQTESAAQAALRLYGLFIEWLETFDPEITRLGFTYDGV